MFPSHILDLHAGDDDAPAAGRAAAPRALTMTLSILHVSPADLTRLREQGWPLASAATAHQVELQLPPAAALREFLPELRELGFSKPLGDLVRWATEAGVECVLFDETAELNDRLLVFVG
jgi:hypothetical protein